jgi:hypothetical protein
LPILIGITAQQLLDALEGVAYLTAMDGTILAIGTRGWTEFASDNGAPDLTADSVIGNSLFATISGDQVRDAYKHLHAAVSSGRRMASVFEYRCDSPIAERRMRMSITAVSDEAGVAAVLYQSQMLTETMRPPLRLFSRESRAVGDPQTAALPMVAMCSFCHRVEWPLGSEPGPRRWINPTDYYRRGGLSDVSVTHGICPTCATRLTASTD